MHADDLHRLISALGAAPVDLFASSGGAINALALVGHHPEDIWTLVALAASRSRSVASHLVRDALQIAEELGAAPLIEAKSGLWHCAPASASTIKLRVPRHRPRRIRWASLQGSARS